MSGTAGPAQRNALFRPPAIVRVLVNPLVSVLYGAALSACLRVDDALAARIAHSTMSALLRPGRGFRTRNMARFFHSRRWSRATCVELDRQYVRFQGRCFLESARLLRQTDDTLRATVELDGEGHLRAALARGGGALLVGAHLGNWLHAPIVLSAAGYPMAAVSFPIPIASVDRHLQQIGARYRVSVGRSGPDSGPFVRRALAENRVVYVLFDASVRPGMKVGMPFGDTRIGIDPGPARLALLYDAPILMVTCEGRSPTRSRVTISPALPVSRSRRTRDGADALMTTWLSWLHAEVARRPEQWFTWAHTRLADPSPSEMPAALATSEVAR